MTKKHVNKAYVSEADKFLHRIKRECGKTDSQQAEYDKHQRIFKRRDRPEETQEPPKTMLWDNF